MFAPQNCAHVRSGSYLNHSRYTEAGGEKDTSVTSRLRVLSHALARLPLILGPVVPVQRGAIDVERIVRIRARDERLQLVHHLVKPVGRRPSILEQRHAQVPVLANIAMIHLRDESDRRRLERELWWEGHLQLERAALVWRALGTLYARLPCKEVVVDRTDDVEKGHRLGLGQVSELLVQSFGRHVSWIRHCALR